MSKTVITGFSRQDLKVGPTKSEASGYFPLWLKKRCKKPYFFKNRFWYFCYTCATPLTPPQALHERVILLKIPIARQYLYWIVSIPTKICGLSRFCINQAFLQRPTPKAGCRKCHSTASAKQLLTLGLNAALSKFRRERQQSLISCTTL